MEDKLYTVKEIAEIIGVSKQAIHKKIKQEPLSTDLQSLMTTTDNTVYIAVDGFNLIKSTFDKSTTSTFADNVDNKIDNQVDKTAIKLIDSLQEQIAFLKEQITLKDNIITNKDEHIKQLTNKITELTDKLTVLLENSQQLQQNQQLLQAQLPDEHDIKKNKPLFLRIFRKK